MFIAQVLVGPSTKLHKEIIQIENNMVKNPNWQEADQLAIYKRGRGVELGATEKQLQLAVRAGLEPGLEQSMKPMIGKSINQSMTIDALLVNWHRLASANQ